MFAVASLHIALKPAPHTFALSATPYPQAIVIPPMQVVVALAAFIVHTVHFSFFFFQAEDGIRDLIVTGVQTCALPICRTMAPASVAILPSAPTTLTVPVIEPFPASDSGVRAMSPLVVAPAWIVTVNEDRKSVV